MSLSRVIYDPFYEFDRLFDEAFNARTGNQQGQVAERNNAPRALRPRYVPLPPSIASFQNTDTFCRMDVHEDPQNNTVLATFELPGLKKEDVNIDVHNSLLTISGESKVSSDRDENGYAVRERRYGKFSRSIPLPEGVKVCSLHSLSAVTEKLTRALAERGHQGLP